MAWQWLEAEHVSTDAHSFRSSGRTAMVSALHIISQAQDAEWMTSFVVPCSRIMIWLDELKRNAEMRVDVDVDTYAETQLFGSGGGPAELTVCDSSRLTDPCTTKRGQDDGGPVPKVMHLSFTLSL